MSLINQLKRKIPLSNEDLQAYLENCDWSWAQVGDRGVELYDIRNIGRESLLLANLISVIFKKKIQFGDYFYIMHAHSLMRTNNLLVRQPEKQANSFKTFHRLSNPDDMITKDLAA